MKNVHLRKKNYPNYCTNLHFFHQFSDTLPSIANNIILGMWRNMFKICDSMAQRKIWQVYLSSNLSAFHRHQKLIH